MKAERDPKTGKWLIQYRYKDWTGKNVKSTKRGFKTKREAEEWLRAFLLKQTRSFDMKFADFVIIYTVGRKRYTLSLENPAGQQNSIRSIAQKSKHIKMRKLSTSFMTANCRR